MNVSRGALREALAKSVMDYKLHPGGSAALRVYVDYRHIEMCGGVVRAHRPLIKSLFPYVVSLLDEEISYLRATCDGLILQYGRIDEYDFGLRVEAYVTRVHEFAVAWSLAVDVYNSLEPRERSTDICDIFVSMIDKYPKLAERLSQRDAVPVLAVGARTFDLIRNMLPSDSVARKSWWYLRDNGPVSDAVATVVAREA